MRIILPVLLFAILSISTLSCVNQSTDKLVIAASANMQFAVKELVSEYTALSENECELILGSSGKLTAQIKQGAPFDVFLSADVSYANELYQSGFSKSNPKIYALGRLVLWTTVPNLDPSLNLLTSDSIKHIALANPGIAPYGKAAMQVLEKYGLDESLNSKFVFGESISQTNQFITSGAAETGFTSLSVVKGIDIEGAGKWIQINSEDHDPIEQAIVVLERKEKDRSASNDFMEFVLSAEGKIILDKFGYIVTH